MSISAWTLAYITIGLMLKKWEKRLDNSLLPEHLSPYAKFHKQWSEPKVVRINGKVVV